MDNKVELLKEAIDLIPRMDDNDPIAPALRGWVDKARKETLSAETNNLQRAKSYYQHDALHYSGFATQLRSAKTYVKALEDYISYLEDEITYIRGG